VLAVLAAALVVSLSAPTHAPKAEARWNYTVHASVAGKPVPGRITVELVDPFGGTHPAQRRTSDVDIVRVPFDGVFRDFLEFPSEAKGLPLTVRVTVVARGSRRVVSYRVTPR
jgi:hypothetical protein